MDRVDGRIPRRTWLESVEADMAEIEMSTTGRNGERILRRGSPTLSENGL